MTCSVCVETIISSVHGVVHEAGVPRTPSISTRHIRQEPNAFSESVAHSLGTSMPASAAARSTEVPEGTTTWRPSIITRASVWLVTAGVPKSGSGAQ